MTDTNQNAYGHTPETDALRNELQVDLQLLLIKYGDKLVDAGHPYVANVVLGEVAALLGDTVWAIHDTNRDHEDVDGDTFVDHLLVTAARRAHQVFIQLETQTDVENIDIQ